MFKQAFFGLDKTNYTSIDSALFRTAGVFHEVIASRFHFVSSKEEGMNRLRFFKEMLVFQSSRSIIDLPTFQN